MVNSRNRSKKNRSKKSIKNNNKIQFIMISYKENEKFAKKTKSVLKRKWGIDCKIVYGYHISDNKKYKSYNVLFHGVLDKMLPLMVKYKKPIYYIEDDVRFTSHPFLNLPKKDVVWSVYRTGNLDTGKKVIRGSQAIYFSKKAVKYLFSHMAESKPIHIDGYFSKFITDNASDLSFEQLKPKIGYEEEHKSLISKKWDKYKKPN